MLYARMSPLVSAPESPTPSAAPKSDQLNAGETEKCGPTNWRMRTPNW